MTKYVLTRPTLILLYGFPGSGKTFFARQLCDELQAAHVQDDRIRHELFESPDYSKHENEIVDHLMKYMMEEFLSAGVSVVFDTNALRLGQRRQLRDIARKSKAQSIMIWLQIDLESAFARVATRDRRKSDNKYAKPLDRTTFDKIAGTMQNPGPTEEYVVISGKHNFKTQSHMVLKKLIEAGLITPDLNDERVVKPGLVNLVPSRPSGRVDTSRRNIIIR